MANSRITWVFSERRMNPRSEEVSAIGIEMTYPDRECGLSIRLLTPLDGKMPEKQAGLAELARLRDALNHILGIA